ncbi:hypothetical protein H4219_002963 [Mycoemilia scoparia]|uniref:COP9 signalosome complex subunit 3 N-terminal helical repeats domain-containing protein n=1 Tax=Mycoemilia scoparia TaxID=417184 RepID=A0A9W8A5J0_9FUNG|nr:hypothetical protein H4219_002963 [Mycoemilia scoparia]
MSQSKEYTQLVDLATEHSGDIDAIKSQLLPLIESMVQSSENRVRHLTHAPDMSPTIMRLLSSLETDKNTLAYIIMWAEHQLSYPLQDMVFTKSSFGRICKSANPKELALYPRIFILINRVVLELISQSDKLDLQQLIDNMSTLIHRYEMAVDETCLTPLHHTALKIFNETSGLQLKKDNIFLQPISRYYSINGITQDDYIHYFFHLGTILNQFNEHSQAIHAFYKGLVYPCINPTKTQVLITKRLILTNLIEEGKFGNLPHYVGSGLLKAVNDDCKAYIEFKDTYEKLDRQAISNAFINSKATFEEDGNTDLAKKAINSIPKHMIKKLASAFTRLPVTKLCSMIGLTDKNITEFGAQIGLRSHHYTLDLVAQMIESGKLDAKVETIVDGNGKEQYNVLFNPPVPRNINSGNKSTLTDYFIKLESLRILKLQDHIQTSERLYKELESINTWLKLNDASFKKLREKNGETYDMESRYALMDEDDVY